MFIYAFQFLNVLLTASVLNVIFIHFMFYTTSVPIDTAYKFSQESKLTKFDQI
jgi:hypothetical protein